MIAKHTPGPWRAVSSMPSEGFNCWWLMAGSRDIATISGYQGDTECEANARLIAAAPFMLEALKIVMQHGRIDNSEARMQLVASAIVKAEGGE